MIYLSDTPPSSPNPFGMETRLWLVDDDSVFSFAVNVHLPFLEFFADVPGEVSCDMKLISFFNKGGDDFFQISSQCHYKVVQINCHPIVQAK